MASRRLNLHLLLLSQFREFLRTLRLISSRAGHAPFLFHLRSKLRLLPNNVIPEKDWVHQKSKRAILDAILSFLGPAEDANTENSTGCMAFDQHHCDPQNVAGAPEPSLLPRNSLGGMVSESRVFRDTASD